MSKNIFYLLFLFFLMNCSMPGTTFLGPVFTGAKTGSAYQASLSLGTSKIMNEIKDSNSFIKKDSNSLIKSELILTDKSTNNKDPVIILSYMVDKVEISEVLEPEPLP